MKRIGFTLQITCKRLYKTESRHHGNKVPTIKIKFLNIHGHYFRILQQIPNFVFQEAGLLSDEQNLLVLKY